MQTGVGPMVQQQLHRGVVAVLAGEHQWGLAVAERGVDGTLEDAVPCQQLRHHLVNFVY